VSYEAHLSVGAVKLSSMSFKFVDLFAGIGGFHGALSALGGKCVYASEIDRAAARVYVRNWGIEPDGDITLAANEFNMDVPEHDVLVGGFPCQPFSKSGKQRGMDEARGTLFWNIAKIIEVRQPKIVLLENVRNIAGPRHTHEWEVIIQTLRDLGYRVSSKPLVVSPHRIHPNFGGRPQVRERVFIAATRINSKVFSLSEEPELPSLEQFENGWDPQKWSLSKHLPLETKTALKGQSLELSEDEKKWISVWEEFVTIYKKKNPKQNLPGFPIWVDEWKDRSKLRIPSGTPEWKENFLIKNSDLYTANKKELDAWLKKYNKLQDFPPSRRKFEWQAQDSKSLYDTIMHFRPSGIRAKKATYVPAMVAITQTSIVGKQLRRISIREGSRLQGLPEWFDFMDQPASATYKQLGNGVNVGAVYNVMKALVIRDLDLLKSNSDLSRSILSAPANPDEALISFKGLHQGEKTSKVELKLVKELG
jgi:DNA (cytosine-5)-methyltransferase 1